MKKSLFIIVLTFILGACSTPGPGPATGRNMLTFDQIAGEISVQHEALESAPDLSATTARNDLNTL